MFQRQRTDRQAGFIRRRDLSKRNSVELYREDSLSLGDGSLEFSPFRNQSPVSIKRILETHRVRNGGSRDKLIQEFCERIEAEGYRGKDREREKRDVRKKQKKHKNTQHNHFHPPQPVPPPKQPPQPTKIPYSKPPTHHSPQLIYQQFYHRSQPAEEPVHRRTLILTETVEEVQEIHCKPEQLNLSLAESFNLHCGRMRDRLERERARFSKSRKEREEREEDREVSMERGRKFGSKPTFESFSRTQNCFDSRQIKKAFPPQLKHRNSDGDTKKKPSNNFNQNYPQPQQHNKENCEQYANTKPKSRTQALQLPLPPTKFFIPAPTSRSKPITPRQAYQHSLKKWKQLPQVVAREKEREKEAQLRERLLKMKMHGREVRRSLKK